MSILDHPSLAGWASDYAAAHGGLRPGEVEGESLQDAIANRLYSLDRQQQGGGDMSDQDWLDLWYDPHRDQRLARYREAAGALIGWDGRDDEDQRQGSGSGSADSSAIPPPLRGSGGYPMPSASDRAAAGGWNRAPTFGPGATGSSTATGGPPPLFSAAELGAAGQGLIDAVTGLIPLAGRNAGAPMPRAPFPGIVRLPSDIPAARGYTSLAEPRSFAPPSGPPPLGRRMDGPDNPYGYPDFLRGSVPTFVGNVQRGAGIVGREAGALVRQGSNALERMEANSNRERDRFFGRVRGLWDFVNQPGR